MMNIGQHRVPIIERAFALAKSGTCQTVADVRLKLKAERYGLVEDFISGRGLVNELKKMCAEAYAKAGVASPAATPTPGGQFDQTAGENAASS